MKNDEYIERNSLLHEVKQIEGVFAAPLIIRKIENAPAEDVLKIVRCRECIHRGETICPMYSERVEFYYDDDDDYGDCDLIINDYTIDGGFCHMGERKEGNNNG